MAKKEFVQLAHTYKKQNVNSWFISEKLDGMRAYWDGGISRGMLKADVPWANCDKDDRYLVAPRATGLWSRYGNVIHAPDWWLDELPPMPLDGELWIGYEYRQDLMKIVKKLEPTQEWDRVGYHVFDVPPFGTMFPDHKSWIAKHKGEVKAPAPMSYSISRLLLEAMEPNAVVRVVSQTTLVKADDIPALLDEVVARNGEGVMLRAPWAKYEACRSHNILKVKPFDDDEGVVVGYTAGKGKYLGMVGNVILDYGGLVLELSGFTDNERHIYDDEQSAWADMHPGFQMPSAYDHEQFPKGTIVTFKYRGKSKDGVPQEARYWRKR